MSDSEEKTLDATPKKLEDARKKGQVPHFTDATSVAILVAGTALLTVLLPRFFSVSQEMVVRALDITAHEDIGDPLPLLLELGEVAASVVLPLSGVLVGVLILVSIVLHKGLIFAVEPIAPKFENIDPVKGFQRVFGMRGLTELLKSLVKLIATLTCLALVLVVFGGDLLVLPGCGFDCTAATAGALVRMLAFAILAILLVLAIVDIPLQVALFARDMKMSITEQRREFKDMMGDPAILQERHRLRHEDSAAPPQRKAIERATLIILGDGALVAYRYVPEEAGVPIVVARTKEAARTESFLRTAVERKIPVYRDAALAIELQVGVAVGEPIPKEHFLPAARAISLARPL